MTSLLSKIDGPWDLKKLSYKELSILAEEIRQVLIKTVAQNGGHLAPNLGVVELTLALHRVFDSPRDQFVWDVGHQSYVHKLLTGRREAFATLRTYQGLSGFPKRKESPHDPFQTGHSSTSISAALGLALARDLNKEKHAVVAIIGDGALTGGMAFEALNYTGHLGTDLIVILNDNEMSIASNVGALASYLSKLRMVPFYNKGKEELEEVLRKIPAFGSKVVNVLEKVKDSVKHLVLPGMFFEELGFNYFGPIDGHNIQLLINVLQNVKSIGGPVLVHVVTKKGKGYRPAEKNPNKFHGIGPFDIESGDVVKKDNIPTYTQVFGDTLIKIGKTNDRVLAITPAMPDGTGLTSFAKSFPDRFFDVGIAEQNAVTMAAGLASQGFKPVVAIYSTFLQRAYDQVLHDVCLQELPVVFAIDRAGIVGEDGETHQGLFDFAFLRHIPGMVVMAPKDENELQHMLKTAEVYPGPISLRYPRGRGVGVDIDPEPTEFPLGKAEVLREGSDAAIIAVGPLVYEALAAADELAKDLKIAVINARFVKPLDKEVILKYAKETGLLLTVEEHVLTGGFGSAVLELLQQEGLSGVKVTCLGVPDQFVEHGPAGLIKEKYGLTKQGMIQAILNNLGKGSKPSTLEKTIRFLSKSR